MIKTILHNDGLLQIVLDAPQGNMLSLEDIELFSETLIEAESNPLLMGILLTGSNRSFCAGLNIDFSLLHEDCIDSIFEKFDTLLYQLFTFPKPVVGAINGHSIGGGLLLQSCVDYSLISCSEKIKLGLPEVKLGLTIDKLMLDLLSYNAVSGHMLERLLLGADFISPENALRLGFVDELVPDDTLLENAMNKLRDLVELPSHLYRTTKLLSRLSTAQNMQKDLMNKSYKVFSSLKTK